MTVGSSTVNLANAWLNVFGGTTFTGITNVYVQLHNGDPGASGTANVSVETTRKVLAWAAASSGSIAINGTLPSWVWAAGADTITHVSLWSASTSGTFYQSILCTASKAMANGDTLNLASLSIAITPLAA